MGFWDRVNEAVDAAFGAVETPSQFPGSVPTGQDEGALGTPDAQRALLADMGYVPPRSENPFSVSPEQLFGTITQATSPFTVIDLSPGLDGGTRGAITSAPQGRVVPNTFPAQDATIQKINKIMGTNILNLPVVGSGVFPQGLTYQIQGAANSLRLERLPQGWIPNNVVGAQAVTQNSSLVTTQLIPNDVNAQTVLNTVLTGCFVQFESTDNPVFVGKNAETYNLPFTKVFITTFGSAGRWRLIFGNKALVTGASDDRALRQNLHMWDGQGLFDSTLYHPVPFQFTPGFNEAIDQAAGTSVRVPLIDNSDSGAGLASQNVGYVFQITAGSAFAGDQYSNNGHNFTVTQNNSVTAPGLFAVGTGAPSASGNLTKITGSGSNTLSFSSVVGNSNVVGEVSNKGYAILWLTGLSLSVDMTPNSIDSLISIALVKTFGDPNTLPATDLLPFTFNPYVQDSFNGSISKNYDFNTPIRIVLAGFDFNNGNPGRSGENLDLVVFNTTTAVSSTRVSIRGYTLGPFFNQRAPSPDFFTPKLCQVPYNPYPGDVNLPVLNGTP